MSSGFGQQGGRGRCFPFFQDFMKCYVQAENNEQCRLQYEDYNECLWHRKEIARLQMVEEEYFKQHPDQVEYSILPKLERGKLAKLHGFGG